MNKEEIKNHVHCRCMNIGKTCPNNHYADCKICNMPHNEQLNWHEQLKKDYIAEFGYTDDEGRTEVLGRAEETVDWWIEKLTLQQEKNIQAVEGLSEKYRDMPHEYALVQVLEILKQNYE